MKHEEKHALGIWLIALFLGGFAVLYWGPELLREREPAPLRPPVERPDTAVEAPGGA